MKHLRYYYTQGTEKFIQTLTLFPKRFSKTFLCYHDETIIFTIKLRFLITRLIFKLLINLAICQTLKNRHAASETILRNLSPLKQSIHRFYYHRIPAPHHRCHNSILFNPKKGYTTVSRSERVSPGSLKSIHESLFDRSELNAVGGQSAGNIFQGHTLAVVNVRPD